MAASTPFLDLPARYWLGLNCGRQRIYSAGSHFLLPRTFIKADCYRHSICFGPKSLQGQEIGFIVPIFLFYVSALSSRFGDLTPQLYHNIFPTKIINLPLTTEVELLQPKQLASYCCILKMNRAISQLFLWWRLQQYLICHLQIIESFISSTAGNSGELN